MAPLGAALSSGQGIGPIFLGGPLRLPHVVLAVAFDPSSAAASASWPPRCRSSASRTTSRRSRRPRSDVKLLDGRGRLFAAGSRAAASTSWRPQRVPGAREGELPAGEIVAEYVNGGRQLIGAYAPVAPWGLGAVVDKTVDAALLPVNRIRLATLFWMAISVVVGVAAARDRSPAGCPIAWRRWRRARSRSPPATWRPASPSDGRDELGDLATAFNQMADRAGRRPQEDHPADQRDHGLEPDAGETRRGQDRRAAPGAGNAAALALAVGAGRAGRRRGARDQQPADRRAGDRAAAARRSARRPSGAARCCRTSSARRCASARSSQNMLRLAQRQSGHDTTPSIWRASLDDAVELCGPSELAGAGHRGRAPVRARARRCGQRHPAAGGVHPADPERARRDAGHRGGKLTLEISGDRDKLVRVIVADTGARHQRREPAAHLRSVLHHQGERPHGLGLGLSFVHRIIEDNGGTIQVESTSARAPSSCSLSPPTRDGPTAHERPARDRPRRSSSRLIAVARRRGRPRVAPSVRVARPGGAPGVPTAAAGPGAPAPGDDAHVFEVMSATGKVEAQRGGRLGADQARATS